MTPSRKASAVESGDYSPDTPQEPKMTDEKMRSAQRQHDRLTPEDINDSLHELAVDDFLEREMDDLISDIHAFAITMSDVDPELPLAWRHAARRHLSDALAQYIADNERAIASDIVAARNGRVEE